VERGSQRICGDAQNVEGRLIEWMKKKRRSIIRNVLALKNVLQKPQSVKIVFVLKSVGKSLRRK